MVYLYRYYKAGYLFGFILVLILVSATYAIKPEYLVDVDPGETIEIKGEKIHLTEKEYKGWRSKNGLKYLCSWEPGRGIPIIDALNPESVIVRHDGRILEKGKDYLLDERWGGLGLAPTSSVTKDDVLEVDYSYSLRRIDSLVKLPTGEKVIRKGDSKLTCAEPPRLEHGEKRLANIFIDFASRTKNPIYLPVLESKEQAKTLTTSGMIPKTLDKIKSGKPVKIVCWGDSVTVGGDAYPQQENRYSAVFEKKLRARFPDANLTVETIAVGGSNSRQWLYPEKYAINKATRWERVAEAKPDLVTIEFVNDAYMSKELVYEVYIDIFNRISALGAEVILITPHFTRLDTLNPYPQEERPYVLALRSFAQDHKLALADAAARWEHLSKEGIPYITLLRNALNHPDNRGHMIFAEELIKCFQ